MDQWFYNYLMLFAVAATAGATVVLGWFTRVLAAETSRLVDAGSRPHIVATIEPSAWSMLHAELKVENTGTATAYAIELEFSPPLPLDDSKKHLSAPPLQSVSVLKPGQLAVSYLVPFTPLIESPNQSYDVKISWKRSPTSEAVEKNSYTLKMSDFIGVSRLGASDPLIQIAEQIKHLREDWRYVASGSKKVATNVYTSLDRQQEREMINRRFQNQEPTADISSETNSPLSSEQN